MGFDLTGNDNIGGGIQNEHIDRGIQNEHIDRPIQNEHIDRVEYASPRTDVMFQEFKLYIEGVQVPFMAISLQSGLGMLPTMTVSIPSQTGIMEIGRYYEPKVHLFFADPVSKESCLLFSGNIVSTSYHKSSQTPAQKYVNFNCKHVYSKMELITMDYSGYGSDANKTDSNAGEAAVKTNQFGSLNSIGMALTGVSTDKVGGDHEVNIINKLKTNPSWTPEYDSIPQYLDDVKNRLTGFPGVPLNLWNQLKDQAYVNPEMYEGMTRMYIPLVEEGLQFFRRIGGHHTIEAILNASKQVPCTSNSTGNDSLETNARLIPPMYQTLMQSATQADIATQAIYTAGQFSGELTSFLKIIQDLMYYIEYDMVFLNAPAEVPKDPTNSFSGVETTAMDVIVKPQMPHYYAPACNVVLPYMFTSISINQDDEAVPTRITAMSDNTPAQSGQFGVNYRAPQSVREAIAKAVNQLGDDTETTQFATLGRTTAASQFRVGKFEQGRGIHHMKTMLPRWLSILGESMSMQSGGSSEVQPLPDTDSGRALEKFRKAWQYRYDPKGVKKMLNPWDTASGINAYQRILFAAVDSKFTTEIAKARTGNVSMIFNPYMVPGYPMDIIDPTPTEPSFHAFCVEVTHTITAGSVGTTASFVSAMSYQELGNYEQHYTHPWLQSVTDTIWEGTDGTDRVIYRTSIVNNTSARDKANDYYKTTLGVGSAPPEFLYDFSTGTPYMYSRVNGSPTTAVPGSDTLHVSGEGNLALAFRPIETQSQHAERFGIKFIDMAPDNYDSVTFAYQEPILDEAKLMEPGESIFLDYSEELAPSRDELAYVASKNSTTTGGQ